MLISAETLDGVAAESRGASAIIRKSLRRLNNKTRSLRKQAGQPSLNIARNPALADGVRARGEKEGERGKRDRERIQINSERSVPGVGEEGHGSRTRARSGPRCAFLRDARNEKAVLSSLRRAAVRAVI